MAMKKDDDKSKRTLSGKKPATFGGANSKLIKPKASAPSGPRAEPSRPMGKDATGSANFDRTSSSRFMVSAGPATMSMGGRTTKSTGGSNMANIKEKKKSNPMAKMSGVTGTAGTSKPTKDQRDASVQKEKARKSANVAKVAIGTIGIGGAISSRAVRGKIKQAAKYIGDTKERKERKRVQKEENDAMIVERNKGKGTMKSSKSTIKKINAR
jgi:uncharacterized protein YcfJ